MRIRSFVLVSSLAVILSAARDDRWKRQVEESPEQTSYEAEDPDSFEDNPPRRWKPIPREWDEPVDSYEMDSFDPLYDLDPLEPWDTYSRRINFENPPNRPTPRQEVTEPPRQPKVDPSPEAAQPTWNVATESAGIVEGQVQSGPQFFIPAHICGARYYCREGGQGPCGSNEIFVAGDTPKDQSGLTCPGGFLLWIRGCYVADSSDVGPPSSYVGYCKAPCSGHPSTFRYSLKARRCYNAAPRTASSEQNEPAVRGPCAHDQMFTDVDGVFGECRCTEPSHVMWGQTDTCHRAFSRGPCPFGEWLVPYNNGFATCAASPCPLQADGHHIYVQGFGLSACYKSLTQGPCPVGHLFVVEDFIKSKASCLRVVYAPQPVPFN